MVANLRKYLEESTEVIKELIFVHKIDNEERNAIIEVFTNGLTENIGNIENLPDHEVLICSTSLKYIDDKLQRVLSNENASNDEYEKAIRLCKRQNELLDFFKTKRIKPPKVSVNNLQKAEETLRKKQENAHIINSIIEKDKKVEKMFLKAKSELSVKACDELISLISELERDLSVCKSMKAAIPNISNYDIKSANKRIAELRKIAIQKEEIHNSIIDLDHKIHNYESNNTTTPQQWKKAIDLCQEQKQLLSEYQKNKWILPDILYLYPDKVISKYKLYIDINEIDEFLSEEKDSLSSQRKYKTFFSKCDKQKNNIEKCIKNGWGVPPLKVSNLSEIYNNAFIEKKRKEKSKKLKLRLGAALVILICISSGMLWGLHVYRKGKVQIPFDPSYVVGVSLNDISAQIDDAGFTNVTKKQDTSGWLKSGDVLKVDFDNTAKYKKGKYLKPNVNVVITYSSDDRIYVTDLLKDWKTKSYSTTKDILTDAGFSNINVEPFITSEKDKENITAEIILNGSNYTNEHCYLPTNAPITIKYYSYKIGIGFSNAQFIGQDYESLISNLKESGFTNVQAQKIDNGWAKGNTVVGVTVNNNDTYKSSDYFDEDSKIIVKYSSDDRIDATSILENWKETPYDKLYEALEAKGFTNIKVVQKDCLEVSNNQLPCNILLNSEPFNVGECYLQKNAPIEIEYYVLTIVIGKKSTSFEEKQYSGVVNELKEKGFTNIKLKRANNLINGWVTDEGSIKSIKIDGKSKFEKADRFYYDAPIVIVVNTFEDKGCEDITEIAK